MGVSVSGATCSLRSHLQVAVGAASATQHVVSCLRACVTVRPAMRGRDATRVGRVYLAAFLAAALACAQF